jgi:hypothetical protein
MARRCYTKREICDALGALPSSTFDDLKRRGRMPFLEELKPRIGKTARYRADLVDQYLANRFQPALRRVR